MFQDNIQMLQETLEICRRGYYEHNGKRVELKLSPKEMETVRVFLPEQVEDLKNFKDFPHVHYFGPVRCGYSCQNRDAFSVARESSLFGINLSKGKKPDEVLVLNLANPVHPGGGVRRGARAQEEDLCRKSSLLLSLESQEAKKYYNYNSALYTYMGSHGIIITPKVEIIRDEKGQLLDRTTVVAVMTCAAPMITKGLEGMSQEEYRQLVYDRITGMLRCAAALGYERLVLGAFGCGAFGNDAKVVSDLFYKALKEFNFDGMREYEMFRRIDFAVLCKEENLYNFKEFDRNFGSGNFYREEDEAQRKAELRRVQKRTQEREPYRDKIRGSMVGGAIGDALGYPVEFMSAKQIQVAYGPSGITAYALDRKTGKALISDDTQMTLFTANGILYGETRLCMRGIGGQPSAYMPRFYDDWRLTQEVRYSPKKREEDSGDRLSWLLDVPELFNRRVPGNTCLSALNKARRKEDKGDYFENPRNNSKGAGGLMRVAPLGLHYDYHGGNLGKLDKEGATLAAITHGHPLGYIPAAVLTHILNRIVYPVEGLSTLKKIVQEAMIKVGPLFRDNPYMNTMRGMLGKAITLAENSDPDSVNIPRLGEGWVAEETLAIAVYCAIRHEHDFSAGIIASVNHNGDSDTTGAVTGNILGAIHGYEAIEAKWKKNLELLDVILEISDDLCYGCMMEEYSNYVDPKWATKYMSHRRWVEEKPYVFFNRIEEENGCFSNSYESGFVIDDFCYDHVQQYLMAQKAKLFHDAKTYTTILRTGNPETCKKLGRQVTPFDGELWDSARYEILKTALRAKFTQNPQLKKALLETGDAIIAKTGHHDSIWGIPLSPEEAADLSPDQWPGQNLLGKALMDIREELKE